MGLGVDKKQGKVTNSAAEKKQSLKVGAPMWTHKEWIGRHFPSTTPQSGSLEVYSTWCNAVEGNTTFYAVPSASTVAKWAGDSPPDFHFCFKLPRAITHDRRLRSCQDLVGEFLRATEPLGDRMGPIMIQLPSSFDGTYLGALISFLDGLSSERDWAVEVRSPDFFEGGRFERSLNDELADRGINRVILDSRPLFSGPCVTPGEIDAFKSKPRLPVRPVTTGRRPVVRLIGLTDPSETERQWGQWVTKVAAWLDEGLEPFVFVHTPDNVDSPPLNRRFHELVSEQRPLLAPLPQPRTTDHQLGLWP